VSRLSDTGVRLFGQEVRPAELGEKRLSDPLIGGRSGIEANATALACVLCESGFAAFPILSLAFSKPVPPSAAVPDFESIAPYKVDR
jgi:hypothetical protein